MKKSNKTPLVLLIAVLLFASLACQQAGEILTPAEATARAEAESQTEVESQETAVDAEFSNGDKVEFTSTGSSVPLFSKAAGRTPFLNVNPGETAFVRESTAVDGVVWYRIEGSSGNGWVSAEFVTAPTEEEVAEEPAFAAGDTALLQGVGFMISLYDDAGSSKIIAQQERGVEVEILDSTTVGAEIWYQVDAPTGVGWVPESFIVPLEE